MKIELEQVLPSEIEKRSFEIITQELGDVELDPLEAPIIKRVNRPLIFAIGNAPTALVRLYELIQDGAIRPELVIGVPVGFVNVVASKELIMQADVPYIVARGRKGGSNVDAAICNAILYQME